MRFQVCDICKVSPKLPDDICISCAFDSEHSRRIILEKHLFQLLDLTRGIVNQVEAAVAMVQHGQIDPFELARAIERTAKALPEPEKTEST